MTTTKFENFLKQCSGLEPEIDVASFIQEAHRVYKALKYETNSSETAKWLFRYVAAEHGVDWHYAAYTLHKMCKFENKNVFDKTTVNIEDWESICKQCGELDDRLDAVLKLKDALKTKRAFKELFFMVASQYEVETDEILIEYVLDAYGWDNVLKTAVLLYEEHLRLNADESEAKELPKVTPKITELEDNAFEIIIGGKVDGVTDRMDRTARHILQNAVFYLKKAEDGKITFRVKSYEGDTQLYLNDDEDILLKILKRNIGLFKESNEFSSDGFVKYATTILRTLNK